MPVMVDATHHPGAVPCPSHTSHMASHPRAVLTRRREIANSLGMNCLRGGYSRRWPSGVHRLAIMLWMEDGFSQVSILPSGL